MFLFCSHGVNPPFQAALDPDPGEFRALLCPGCQRRDGGLAVLPRRFTALQLRRQQAHIGGSAPDRKGQPHSRIHDAASGICPRGGGPRWRADRPYHVALEDTYIRAHWDEIYALCKINSLPFNSTGEVIQNDGLWRVYEFTWQMDAILFWDRFNGRWLRGTEFTIPSGRSTCRP
jgi:hypothetical protein